MIIIGERINSTRANIQEAIKNKNAAVLLRETDRQLKAGADYIDINCAMSLASEVQDIDWLVSVIQSEIKDVNLCIDSPNYLAIQKALAVYKGRGRMIINSITGDEARIKTILPLALKHNAKVIALTMDEKGMPDTAIARYEMARKIMDRVKRDGMKEEDIYFDPLIRPIAAEPKQAKEFLDSIPMIKKLGHVHVVCGLSNVSFGLPNRSLINSIFLSMAIHAGLDGAIVDPLDKKIISSIKASRALLCKDDYCADYLKAFREERLV